MARGQDCVIKKTLYYIKEWLWQPLVASSFRMGINFMKEAMRIDFNTKSNVLLMELVSPFEHDWKCKRI